MFVVFCPVVFGRDGKLRGDDPVCGGDYPVAAGDIRDTGFRCHRGTGNCLRGGVVGIGGD